MTPRTFIRRCAGLTALAISMAAPALVQAQALVPDVQRGQQLVESRCFACHSLDANRAGPALRGVVGRKAGKAEGYFFSEAMAAATHTWTVAGLKAWLTNPEKVVPGQEMNYYLTEAQDREDVVAYLASVSKPAQK
ncbi:c-type cytochrome [Rhodoferax mekongensis]|uniref:c-type cytochrome n=1 Tax=Rhodoferax mekongensis TaxID=3068341 RepID=UPI0028BD5E02|nr:c-type cytochrome [Rhodoferax sp. TBRC 17199]MDT7516208.1 c-type cytochrome [Rhodoferax sp. TBRC 17199]